MSLFKVKSEFDVTGARAIWQFYKSYTHFCDRYLCKIDVQKFLDGYPFNSAFSSQSFGIRQDRNVESHAFYLLWSDQTKNRLDGHIKTDQ